MQVYYGIPRKREEFNIDGLSGEFRSPVAELADYEHVHEIGRIRRGFFLDYCYCCMLSLDGE